MEKKNKEKFEAQRAQSGVINSMSGVKEFHKIQTVRDEQKQKWEKNCTYLLKCLCKAKLQILWIQPLTQTMPRIGKEIHDMQQNESLPRALQEWKRQSNPQ